MKKITTIILILFLGFGIVSCSSSTETNSSDSNTIAQSSSITNTTDKETAKATQKNIASTLISMLATGFKKFASLLKTAFGSSSSSSKDDAETGETLTSIVQGLTMRSFNGAKAKKLSSDTTCSGLAKKYGVSLKETSTSKKSQLICLALNQKNVAGDCYALAGSVYHSVYGENATYPPSNTCKKTAGAIVRYYSDTKSSSTHTAIYLGNDMYMDGNAPSNDYTALIRTHTSKNETDWFSANTSKTKYYCA